VVLHCALPGFHALAIGHTGSSLQRASNEALSLLLGTTCVPRWIFPQPRVDGRLDYAAPLGSTFDVKSSEALMKLFFCFAAFSLGLNGCTSAPKIAPSAPQLVGTTPSQPGNCFFRSPDARIYIAPCP
jgi:hypothetical protein